MKIRQIVGPGQHRQLALGMMVLGWLCCSGLAQSGSPDTRPNVILVLTDDQGWWDIGIHGNPHIQTPVMDRLAGESVRFTHFYAQPLCAPTRAALLTGRHYQRTGTVDTYMGLESMSVQEVTLGQVFQEQGYETALIGKWHLGRYLKYHPTRRGFDEFFGLPLALVTRYFEPDQLYQGTEPVKTTGYITDILTDQAIQFVTKSSDRRFFLYLSYNAAHSPYLVPDSYIEPYLKQGLALREARIYGMVTSLDDNLDRLLKTVDDEGLRENTIVVFMSDNGGMSRHFRAGLRGEKGLVWEGGVRVPFMARWPGRFAAGSVVDAPAQDIDVFPTLLALAGLSLPDGVKLDGKNLTALLTTGKGPSPHEYLFHQWNHIRPVMDLPSPPIPHPSPPDWLADHPVVLGAVPFWAVQDVRTGYKLVRWTYRHNGELEPRDELYNLRQDPGETRDLAAFEPEIAERLRQRFSAWFSDVTQGQDYSLEAIEVGHDQENPVEIELLRAHATGPDVKLTFNRYFRDVIERWSDPGTSLRWQIEVIQPGRYEVIFDYGCAGEDAGSKILVRIGEAELTHVVKATAGTSISRPLSLGTLRLDKGPAVLEIRALTLKGQTLMNIYKIRLKRI